MRILSRTIFREILSSAALGAVLFTFVLFLRNLDRLFELLVRSSASPLVVAKLFLYAIPATIPFSLPLGVLVGVLIALSRMSADGEITAMRAAGVPSVSVVRPVLAFSACGLVITALASLWIVPLTLKLTSDMAKGLAAAQLTTEIQPRIFEEQFPNTVLYVDEVVTGVEVVWRRLMLADVTSSEDLEAQHRDRGEGPKITIAEEAVVTPDSEHNRIQLNMKRVHTAYRDKDGHLISEDTPEGVYALEAQKPSELHLNHEVSEIDTGPLYKRVYKNRDKFTHDEWVEAAIEFHKRFAIPIGCVLLALVGIPLGVSSRKGGKSTAFVLTVLLAFLYYTGLISLIGIAKKGTLTPAVAVWLPDAIFAVVGLVLLLRLERPGDRDIIGSITALFRRLTARFRRKKGEPASRFSLSIESLRRFGMRPMLIDAYVLNGFLFYFGVVLLALVLLTEVFTFFELVSDMIKNQIAMSTMVDYLWNLAPKLIYDETPLSVVMASLICFTILTKNNEVTAFKAGGVSVHRLTVPVLFAAGVISMLLFTFDHFYIPGANRRQEALRSKIKNKPIQTYLRPDRQWVYGMGPRIYNYRYLDPREAIMSKANVYEFGTHEFKLVRQIAAERAVWEPNLKTWIFVKGFSNLSEEHNKERPALFEQESFKELVEPPSWFVKEEKQYKEMNFQELGRYIRELKASGLDTIRLQVQYHKKFAVPLFALIMAVLSSPFAFVAGRRGAMTGVGISLCITIAYFTVGTLFEQVGNLNQLPPAMAAWSPDVIFLLAGLYFMARMKT
jgi:LPS export ABC transporter permease LptG/LPS export ABC transporter permease LptF